MFDEFEGDVKKIYTNGIDIVYFMRGSISITEMKQLTPLEISYIRKYIEKRLEEEMKKPTGHVY
jgi:putative cell wall-binding protein